MVVSRSRFNTTDKRTSCRLLMRTARPKELLHNQPVKLTWFILLSRKFLLYSQTSTFYILRFSSFISLIFKVQPLALLSSLSLSKKNLFLSSSLFFVCVDNMFALMIKPQVAIRTKLPTLNNLGQHKMNKTLWECIFGRRCTTRM